MFSFIARLFREDSKFVAVKIFPSPEIGVFAAVTNYFFQFMLPLLVLMFIYSHIAAILWSKSSKNALTEVLHFLIFLKTIPYQSLSSRNQIFLSLIGVTAS